jgi:CubicO group peptidase (beta-lactamase class C family)
MLRTKNICAALCFLLSAFASSIADAPTIDPANDLEHLGSPGRFLFWEPRQKVAGFRNIDKIFPTRTINAGETAFLLPEDKRDLGGVKITYADKTLTVDEYFVQQNVAGLLVIKDGKIVYERYGLGNTPESRWVSFSVAKSVVSLLVGAAIKDGYIKDLDEPVTDYLPRLKGSPYDKVTIGNLLQMASGVRWNEDYADPQSDVNQADWSTLGLCEFLRKKPREAEPGKKFNYNSAETNLVGTLLRSAIGNNLSTYLTEKIWRPFGMESDANWLLTERGGGESGGCCLSATLRDYGRLGLFALNGGRLADGTRVIPRDWMDRSTTPSEAYRGYGYLWWLTGSDVFKASGIFGQGIYIDRKANVVIALHSARDVASKSSDWSLQDALCEALTDAVR